MLVCECSWILNVDIAKNYETRTYVSVSDMLILRRRAVRFHERRTSNVTFTSAHFYGNVNMRVGAAPALAYLSDFWLLEERSSQKWEIPCLGRR